MLESIISTDKLNYSALITRVALGSVMFAHGAQKLLGWFGGFGFDGTMGYFTGTVGLPWFIAFLVIIIESIGSLFLILGVLSRVMALAISAVTFGIIVTAHNEYFFMNWFGNQPAEGYEFFLLMLGLGISIIFSGGGAWSVDGFLSERNLLVKPLDVLTAKNEN